jgi:chemotaxis response regulator CheB
MAAGVCTVFLCGDSLILAGVRASLSTCTGITLVQLALTQRDAQEMIRDWCPAVVILDLNAPPPDFQLALLQQPRLALLTIDAITHRAWVWTGWETTATDAMELLSVIQKVSDMITSGP